MKNKSNQNLSEPKSGKWNFYVDRGGTFTDVIGVSPEGHLDTVKMLSINPDQYDDAAIAGILKILKLPLQSIVPKDLVEGVRMGTTVATNALLERKGSRVLYVTTKGLADSLRIGYQNRPDIFALKIDLPEQLHSAVLEIEERILADGSIFLSPNPENVKNSLQNYFELGFRSIGINLMHGYKHPHHERLVRDLAYDVGFTHISTSHEVIPIEKFIARGDTTVVDAYLTPILKKYINIVKGSMPGVNLLFMKSNGGLTCADNFYGKDALLSGPAGGIVGMVRSAQEAGCQNIIGFDMGGTSTDVSHYSGEFERQFETKVAGVRVCAPMLSIHTVAAGGGSILHYNDGRLIIGPDSAGANPGPACYRRGGELTVTDCNVMLGRIQPKYFPKVFGPNGDEPLDKSIVISKFANLANQISLEQNQAITAEQLAIGYLKVAIDNMATAIKVVSTQKGYDVTNDYTLVTFGGAGGQHACQVADQLGIKKIFVHKLAGVLSAYGMGLADQISSKIKTISLPLNENGLFEARSTLEILKELAKSDLLKQGIDDTKISYSSKFRIKYEGSTSEVEIENGTLEEIKINFEKAHKQLFSYIKPYSKIIIQSIVLEAIFKSESPLQQLLSSAPETTVLEPIGEIDLYSGEVYYTGVPVHERNNLRPGDKILGPCMIIDQNSTNIVESGWQATIDIKDQMMLTRDIPRQSKASMNTDRNSVMLEIFNNQFMYTAELMGLQLQLTAASTNIRDRLDFSCAIFDPLGNLVANAPHIPVHLGSMSDSIKTIIQQNRGKMKPSDVFALNDPYNGGTHLPDITVVTPVFNKESTEIIFFVASRGHHADVGGLTPGSMAPNSTTIEEEGVLLNNIQVVKNGVFQEQLIRKLLSDCKYPARNIDENISDLQAQIAANHKGASILLELTDEYGLEVVQAYMTHVQTNAKESVQRAIEKLSNGSFHLVLDNGADIKVTVTVDKKAKEVIVDFTGTSNQVPNNFNAPLSITTAAVLYVFRCLVDSKIPLNAGCLEPIKIIVPEGSMLNPKYPAAVVAGNVETSSCITNALFGALGVVASSPSTMSNLTFGNSKRQYYETLAGGSGAGDGFHGTAVVQTNMTNSLLTDPEILENTFDVLLLEHSIRKSSGGSGKYKGGDGAVRRIMFLSENTASILSNNRVIPPHGMNGGENGSIGKNEVIYKDGKQEILLSCDSRILQKGDIIKIETPGGGGYGIA